MTLVEMVENMEAVLVVAKVDAAKADAGNKAAGGRVRKGMQDVIAQGKEVRKAVLALRG